jgi:hypothetical protein
MAAPTRRSWGSTQWFPPSQERESVPTLTNSSVMMLLYIKDDQSTTAKLTIHRPHFD